MDWCGSKGQFVEHLPRPAHLCTSGYSHFIPEGSDTDPTRLREYYDGTYNYS